VGSQPKATKEFLTMTEQTTVAVLGAGGTMGRPMARNLAQAGLRVRAWNRSPEKAQSLQADGAQVLDSPAAAGDGADIVVTMLADTDAVLESVAPALQAAGADVLWLQMSTVGEAGTERCLALARERGVGILDAPVLGTKQPAEDGALVVLASGSQELRERAQPVFDAVGQKTIWVGEAGAGTRLKLVANSWVLTVVEGTAETIALAEGLGVDPQLFFDAIEGGALDLPYLRLKGKAILGRDFEPSFSLRLAAKDARLVDQAARAHELELPLFAATAQRMTEGAEIHGEKDLSATYLTAAGGG
jgi:3-hydroxyisobutyrate dehydrogenase